MPSRSLVKSKRFIEKIYDRLLKVYDFDFAYKKLKLYDHEGLNNTTLEAFLKRVNKRLTNTTKAKSTLRQKLMEY